MNCTRLFITIEFYHPWSGDSQCARFIVINTFLFTIGKLKHTANTITTRNLLLSLNLHTNSWREDAVYSWIYSLFLHSMFWEFFWSYGELVSSHIYETVESTTLGSVICNLPDSSTTVFYSRLESQTHL
jgi:hypothetical protein